MDRNMVRNRSLRRSAKAKWWGVICFILLFVSCTVKKNTPATRAYHALTAHYNTL